MTVRNMTGRGWRVIGLIWLLAIALDVAGLLTDQAAFSYLGIAGVVVLLSASFWPWFQKDRS